MAKEYRGRASCFNINTKGYGLMTSANIVYIKDDRNRAHIRFEFEMDGKPYSIEMRYCDIKRTIKEANKKWLEEGEDDRLSD